MLFHALTACPTQLRGEDTWGSGAFGAPRAEKLHRGVDIVTTPGDVILSPVPATIVREAVPYDDDDRYSGVLLQGLPPWQAYTFKIFYMQQTASTNTLKAGDKLGIAQDIGLRYPDITNHIHLEMWQDDGVINPTAWLPLENAS